MVQSCTKIAEIIDTVAGFLQTFVEYFFPVTFGHSSVLPVRQKAHSLSQELAENVGKRSFLAGQNRVHDLHPIVDLVRMNVLVQLWVWSLAERKISRTGFQLFHSPDTSRRPGQ